MTNPTTYLFVDGGHLRKYYEEFANKWFGNDGELDFTKIKADFNADKCFYFDCVDDASKFRELRKSDWRVELGFLRNGKKREQKEVDTLIAVSMVRFAYIGKMSNAILLSGDTDFRPVVEELVRMDVDVKIVGNKNNVSQELMGEATSVQLLDIDDYYKWTKESVKTTKTLEKIKMRTLIDVANAPANSLLLKNGKYLQDDITLKQENESSFFLMRQGQKEFLFIASDSPTDLEIYFELKYGKIDWN